MKKLNRIIHNSLHFLSSNFINFSLGLVTSVILARSLQPNNLGIFHQVQWFTGLISTLISLGFITCIIKFTAGYKARGKTDQIASMVRFVVFTELFIAGLSTVALLFFATPIADHYFSPDESILFFISFLSITPGIQTAIFSALLEGVQVFKYQHIQAFTITPASLITKILLMVTGHGVESLIWTNLAFSLINLTFYYFAVKREKLLPPWYLIKKYPAEERKDLLRYNRSVFSISVVDLIVWTRSENYFLGRYCEAAQVAYYNLAQNLILKFTGVITNMMWRILLPVASEFEGDNNQNYRLRTYYHAVRFSAFIIFPLITTCFVASYELIVIFFGQEYAGVQPCFQVLCLGALITSLSQPGSAVIYAANKQGFIFWYGLVLAILNITLNFLLIPRYGALGASWCFTIVTVLGASGGFYYTSRRMKLKIPFLSLFKIALGSACMGALVYFLIRLDSGYFDFLEPFSRKLHDATGIGTNILFGARTIRLLFTVCLSGLLYGAVAFVVYRPSPDDVRILEALKQFLPKWLVAHLIRKSRHDTA